jgi:glutamate-1-semialdehyde 2,1-aminomutase
MKVVAIVQARMGSSRLPNKVMRPILGWPMIGVQLARLKESKMIDQIIVATTTHGNDDELFSYVNSLGYFCYRGDESDVLSRFVMAAQSVEASIVVRITGDCPLVDPVLVDTVIERFIRSGVDYASNTMPPTYPDGLDVEVFSLSALRLAHEHAQKSYDREHVTPYIRNTESFLKINVSHFSDLSSSRWTVDEIEDYEVIVRIFENFSPKINFNWVQVHKLEQERPEIFLGNLGFKRNEGAEMSNGQKLWRRAKKIIPGGNMLLSKRPEMFLPDYWPTYFSKAKGCMVWDLDGNKFTDMSIMGIGTNILGYGHSEVDSAVSQAVANGNMSTLNCPEEVYLAERLVELHPWAEMVRLARTGGEANAIAIRIARAASGRDNVAICGYHGWHDWYLSANLSDQAGLDGHLLPGLNPLGVPRALRDTIFPFEYNNIKQLEDLVLNKNLGIIKMEVQRNHPPQDGFLEKVRALATKNNIVLIFDECTSGFRETYGGLHLKYGVDPDIAMFGKALGNGYAITAIIGRRDVMEAAQSTFISSTFWTERIGPVAALKTLDVMGKNKSWEVITRRGEGIKIKLDALAQKHSLSISQWGIPALCGYTFDGPNSLAYKTLVAQEMLKKGYLAGNSVYVSEAHNDQIIENFFIELDSVFSLIQECEDGRDLTGLLKGPVCHSGFKRLN